MEYVEGTELRGPMPVSRAVELGSQILDALDAALRKGITHRDLKPANILVTKSGIKVLDFGLAKSQATALGPDAPTLLTAEGTIAGTLHYMAPEQLQGRPDVDGRADIFSFGCVLYEMLTGKRAFDGKDAASVIAAKLERPAPSIATVAPPALDGILQIALTKDPDQRWQSVRDLSISLALTKEVAPKAVPAVYRNRVACLVIHGITCRDAGLGWCRPRCQRIVGKTGSHLHYLRTSLN